ncbi:hypothetical protein WJX74_001505 [Apatococcus lobatus]|uniref:Uncharacterized protein n=1 Tax=Apatococcus lobatus TaxID=904363 RepID=A0AAW1S4K0_9CHLO
MVFCVQALIGMDPEQIKDSFWPAGMDEDDTDMLEAVIAYFQEPFCPEGVVVVCVAGIPWLTNSKPQHFLYLNGKTAFVFVNLHTAPKWLKPHMPIHDINRLKDILHAILGLLKLTTSTELDKAHAKCVAQAHGEHLAANSMLALRSQQGLDVPVILTDGTTYYLALTAEGNSGYVLFSSLGSYPDEPLGTIPQDQATQGGRRTTSSTQAGATTDSLSLVPKDALPPHSSKNMDLLPTGAQL